LSRKGYFCLRIRDLAKAEVLCLQELFGTPPEPQEHSEWGASFWAANEPHMARGDPGRGKRRRALRSWSGSWAPARSWSSAPQSSAASPELPRASEPGSWLTRSAPPRSGGYRHQRSSSPRRKVAKKHLCGLCVFARRSLPVFILWFIWSSLARARMSRRFSEQRLLHFYAVYPTRDRKTPKRLNL
jgi:hypothetical protein